MPFDDLRQWIAALDRAGELKRIQTEADPILEIAEITDRVSKIHKWGRPPSAVQSSVARRPAAPPFYSKTSKATQALNSSSTSSAPKPA